MKKLVAIIFVNLLTTIRIIGVICLLPIFKQYGGVAAALLSIGCYFTDCLDGIIARKCHVSTFFGSMFDGVADKLFSCANLLVLLTITKLAIVPIIFELIIVIIQAIKFSNNVNIQSSKAGKLKTWVISLTVIISYLVSDINKLAFLPIKFTNYINSLNVTNMYLVLFIPLYLFEVLTLISYLKFLGVKENNPTAELPKINIKFKKSKTFKDKWDNFCLLWLNNEFYETYKDCANLKDIRKYVKNNR